jgi:hypothetical protein
MRATGLMLSFVILLIGGACAAASPGAGPARTQTSVITAEEIRERGQYSHLYDLVQALRPRWVQTRGPDTFIGQPGQVQVHVDGNRLGSVDALRTLSPSGVTSIRWVAPTEAAALYGLDHSHGAIIVSTRPVH